MCQKKRLKKIESNSFEMGNKMYKTFKKEGGTEVLRASVAAYDTTLRAIKYKILFAKKR
jgi:hypothetical protein